MSLEQTFHVLDIIKKDVNPEFLVLFGGEPLVHKHIEQIVDRVNEMGFNYTLITNGTIDNEKVIRKLKGLTLSIDRSEQIAGKQDEQSKSNWAMLRKYKDIVPDLVTNVTVTSENIYDLEKIVDQLNELDIWIIFGLVHSTHTQGEKAMFRSHCPELMLSEYQAFKFNKILQKVKKRHNTLMYGKLAEVYGWNLLWHCVVNPRNPEYMTILNNGQLVACNDHWGEETSKLTIFDVPNIGLEKWHSLCKKDRAECRLFCMYNHEGNLMYPEHNSLVHGENTLESKA
jgi:MoaA/NifB/PqqE/SkfB family radical SAM enzyme